MKTWFKMGINLDNYEQYFLDYLEGNLSPEMARELNAFLRAHPELKGVLEDYEAVTIVPDESVIYHPKSSLKKNIHSPALIKDDDLEKIMISSVEGLLDPEEEAGLQQYLRLSPEKAREMEIFRMTRIPVDPAITFPYKSRLKRKAIILSVPRLAWGLAAAAAVIIVALGIRYFSKVEENPAGFPVRTASEIPAVSPEETPAVTPAASPETTPEESRKDIAVSHDRTFAAVQVNEHVENISLERPSSFRIEKFQEASSLPGPKKYSIHRLKKRPVEKMQTFEAKDPSLFAKVTDKIFSKTSQDIKESIGLDEIRKPRLNFWTALSAGIKGYNKITDREIELFVHKNDEGKVSSYALIEQDRLILNRERNIE